MFDFYAGSNETSETLKRKLNPAVLAVYEALNVKMMSCSEFEAFSGERIPYNAGGGYHHLLDVIFLRDYSCEINDLDTAALHELAHWSGHRTRANRPSIGTPIYTIHDENYHTEEATAQLCMHKLANWLGVSEDKIDYFLSVYLGDLIYANRRVAEIDADKAFQWIKTAYSNSPLARRSASTISEKCA